MKERGRQVRGMTLHDLWLEMPKKTGMCGVVAIRGEHIKEKQARKKEREKQTEGKEGRKKIFFIFIRS